MSEVNQYSGNHHVVIVGGGFGGLMAAYRFKRQPVDVTVIDRRNFHLFQPLLYQVATGGLSPANIASPLRSALRRQANTRVLLGTVDRIDVETKKVHLRDGAMVPFDSLIVAAGATHSYFGNDAWEPFAPGLKSIEDATEIRRRVLSAFERAERSTNMIEIARLLTFVIVGGGPTGVEMAGAIRELALHTMRYDFRIIDPAACKVILVEGQNRVLGAFAEPLCVKAKNALEGMGIEVQLNSIVTGIADDHVLIKTAGHDVPVRIDAATVVWAAGVRANPLGKALAAAVGIETDRAGRVPVNADCTLGPEPNIFVIGDLALYKQPDGKPLPGVAPVAMQQGRYVADTIIRRVKGKTPLGPFKYRDKGTMATIGRAKAVAQTMGLRFSGYPAWLAWLFIHIMYLTRFENRVLVLMQWCWNYVTRNRAARLITGAGWPCDPSSPD
jgi:NADH dehydrogenase